MNVCVYLWPKSQAARAGGSVLHGLCRQCSPWTLEAESMENTHEWQKLRSDSLLGSGSHKSGQGTLLTTTCNLGAKKCDPGQWSQCQVTNWGSGSGWTIFSIRLVNLQDQQCALWILFVSSWRRISEPDYRKIFQKTLPQRNYHWVIRRIKSIPLWL